MLVILVVPTFWRMLRSGIYTIQDPHFFRLVEFDKCIKDFQIPCRWSADAGLGYGEPLFNFYGQLPYAVGEVFHLVGFSYIDSLKTIFIISLVGSAIAMYFFSRYLWGSSWAGFLSAIIYTYAPYRAVDVWVRGALPEALAFVIFPLIMWRVDVFIDKGKIRDLLWSSLLIALLILIHNLSLLLFAPVLGIWIIFKLFLTKQWRRILQFILIFLLAGGLAAFYILPVLFEVRYVNLESTIKGYFDFRGHFTNVNQLLLSRFWGYGASVFGPEDDLSLAVGYVQWILPIILLFFPLLRKKIWQYKYLYILVALGWFSLFLTHNKSTFIWQNIGPMAYFQFPWRFLTMAVFCFALAGGALALFLNQNTSQQALGMNGSRNKLVPKGILRSLFVQQQQIITLLIVSLAIFLNYSFFKEDIWLSVNDSNLTKGQEWENQMRMSIGDYWPKFGSVPATVAFQSSEEIDLMEKRSNVAQFKLKSDGKIEFPITYFPGWIGWADGKKIEVYPGENGLVSSSIPNKTSSVTLRFQNTPIRTVGNYLSIVSIIVFLVLLQKNKYAK